MTKYQCGDVLAHRSLVQAVSALEKQLAIAHNIHSVLIFGSHARGTATASSDLDIIFLVNSSRSATTKLYSQIAVDGVLADVNVLDRTDLNRLVHTPSWQYRFCDALRIGDTSEDDEHIHAWLTLVKNWIATPAARRQRIWVLRELVRRLMARMASLDSTATEGRSLLLALALERSIFLRCELNEFLPTQGASPLETAFSGVEAVAENIWRGFGSEALTSARLRHQWKQFRSNLKALAAVFPRFMEEASTGCDAGDACLALTDDELQRPTTRHVVPDTVWSEERAKSWITQAVCDSTALSESGPLCSSLIRVFTRIKPISHQQTGTRFQEYDIERRRLKVIFPTGGCRLPTCTFCRLPELAHKANATGVDPLLDGLTNSPHEVAIYTDGSFFDDREVGETVRLRIARQLRDSAVPSVTVESLPQFVSKEKIEGFIRAMGGVTKLTIASGLQSSNAEVRRRVLGTPTSSAAFERFFALKNELNFNARIYLIYGKPLMTADEDEEDLHQSLSFLSQRLDAHDRVSINYLNVVPNSHVEFLARKGFYVSPSLCRFRAFFQHWRRQGYKFQISPGAIAVRTCSNRELDTRRSCNNCRSWLMSAENLEPLEFHGLPCTSTQTLSLDLPWALIGNLGQRCEFLQSAYPVAQPASQTRSSKSIHVTALS